MKKLICLLLIVFLFSCNSNINSEEIIDVSDEYIEPINEVSYFELLNETTKNKIKDLYEATPANNVIKMLKKDFFDGTLIDYYGSAVDFSTLKDKSFVFEISQIVCDHCQKQLPLMETILEKSDDLVFQYFANAENKDDVDEFYDKNAYAIPKELTVLIKSEEMGDYITELGVDSTPTFLFVNKGIIEFACVGQLPFPRYSSIKRLAFENPLAQNELVTNDGQDIFSLTRDYDDVLNDLSTASKDKLALIDNSEELTVNVIGQYVEFFTVYELGEEPPIYTLDFTKYVNKPLIVFYLGNVNNNLENDISIINEFIKDHKNVNMVAILMDNKDLSTSVVYKNLDVKLDCDVVSSNAEVVVQLLDTKVYEYPAALFIQDNVFTGGVYKIQDADTLNRAYDTFLGEGSIAKKVNN